MKKYLAALLLAGLSATAHAQIKVIKVTTLNDYGTGSLRECVEQTGPRACVFEIGGRIKQQNPLRITSGELRIAGESAPESVVISGAGVSVEASNVVLSHLEIRAGDLPVNQKPGDRDSLKILGVNAQNILIENCSLSWGFDENFSTYGPVSNVTVRDSIIAEGMRFAGHPEQGTKGHSMGALVGIGGKRISFIRNLFVSNHDRNVRWRENSSGEVINNLVFNWGGTTSWNTNNVTNSAAGAITLDYIGNYYTTGPDSKLKTAFTFFAQDFVTPVGSKFYVKDNIGPLRPDSTQDDWKVVNVDKAKYSSETRVVNSYTGPILPVGSVIESVLRNAGAKPWQRNPVDARIIAGVRAGAGAIIDCVENCGAAGPAGQVLVPAQGGYSQRAGTTRTLSIAESVSDADLQQFLANFREGSGTPTPIPQHTPTPGVTPDATATATPQPTATAVSTATAVPARTATAAPTRTVTPIRTATPTAGPGGTVTFDTSNGFKVNITGAENPVLYIDSSGRTYVRNQRVELNTATGATLRDALKALIK